MSFAFHQQFIALVALSISLTTAGLSLAGPIHDLIHDPGTSLVFNGAGANPEFSIDPDFSTAWTDGSENQGTGGGDNRQIQLVADFPSPRSLDSITFRYRARASTTGTTDRERQGDGRIEYQIAGQPFVTLPGSVIHFGINGGDGSDDVDSGIITLSDLNLTDVVSLRATIVANSFANNGRTNGSSDRYVYLYGLQVNGVPEPATNVLMLLGGLAVVAIGTNRRRRSKQS